VISPESPHTILLSYWIILSIIYIL